MNKFSHHETSGVPLKLWDSHQPFEAGAMQQLRNVASLPFVKPYVATPYVVRSDRWTPHYSSV